MSEQEKFNQWWESKGVNSVILRAQAWSAWLARAEAEQQPQPAEDPDEWVIQDRVAPREGIDQVQWDYFSDKNHWPYAQGAWPDHKRHGYRDASDDAVLSVRCRRRDLPKVEQPEQWPKYYTTLDSPSSDVAFVKRVDETSYSVVYKNGRECPGFLWVAQNQSRRKQITEAEAMALLKEPDPQPQKTTSNTDWSYHEKQKPEPKKTMLRLWIDSDCNIHAGLKGDRDLELHYDHKTRQFYTEETR